jgi:allantoinase
MRLRSRRVVLPDGIRPASIEVVDGRIGAIDGDAHAANDVFDVGDWLISPGVVDTHVHINEPGRTGWEGFATATRAAAAGGITTLVDMPLNSVPPTTTVAGLEEKRRAATARCHVDVGFWGGVVPGNTHELEALVRAGVRGFKCFLSPSGVDEFSHVSERDLHGAMSTLARLDRPLLVHAEWPAALPHPVGDPRHYRTWLDSRPAAAEVTAIEVLIRMAGQHRTHVHIVHLATADALPMLGQARLARTPITVETCPHYLTFAAEEIADGSTLLKCAPPIREAAERERLWAALLAGQIDMIATDHSPAPVSLKHVDEGNFIAAWGGIASLQVALPAVWSQARTRGASELDLARWLSEAPARLAGLYPRKGVIAPGADADLVIWDPDGEIEVDARRLYHRHPVTPYHGRRLRGRVLTTILRGRIVFEGGECRGSAEGALL